MASSTEIIRTYQYTYGAGSSPNRELVFCKDRGRVIGLIRGKVNNSWEKIGEILESNMTLETASTTEKMRIMMAARDCFATPMYPQDQQFDQIAFDKKVDVITKLQPDGPYRITITNNIGTNPRFEMVERLTFFDPS